MAFLVQHSMGRAIAKRAAAARERKPRYNIRIAVKNPSKLEPRQLALRLISACLLALLICVCVAKLLSVLSSQILSGNGVYLIEGNRVGSQAEGIGAGSKELSSWEGSASVDVPQDTSAPPILAGVDGDPSINSPELALPFVDTAVRSDTVKSKTDVKIKLATEGHATSSAGSDPPPEKNVSSRKSPKPVTEIEVPKPKSKITCDDKSEDEGFPYARPIVCNMSGDVRVSPGSSSVTLTTPLQQGEEGRRIRPYARQDDSLLPRVREVVIKAAASESDAPKCSVSHDVPSVIFSIGGYTGNFFHDMSDVLIPLYLTSFQFKGRVRFFIANYKQWWLQKYKPMLRRLSHYDIINFDTNKGVHCFHHVILGLVRDRDLILRRHPTRNPKGYSMVDFTRFLRHSYGLRRDRPLVLGEKSGKKPRMLIISRRRTRKLLNLHQVEAMARALGFDVIVSEAGGNVKRFATTVNSCDVLLAVHGAGLTNQVFLPTQAVVIQVVPWGKIDWMAANFYGQPARGMNLRYLEYYIAEEESSLARRYPRDHMVFRDPMAIHGQGWKALADIVMTQDVRLNPRRFRPTLLHALDLLQE